MAMTIPKLQGLKKEGRKISMVTAYDATFARLADLADVDMILVGDSLGMVVQGKDNTLSVTLDEMIYHTRCVMRAHPKAHVMADMPFMSYQASVAQAVENSGRVLKESGAQSVKMEGGLERVTTVKAVVQAGIPVMAHIGLKPQNIHQMGGYVVQGRSAEMKEKLIAEALAFQDAGAFGLLLEGIPRDLAGAITAKMEIPTIGIGAGPACDGQVLVINDLLGMDQGFNPKFAKPYAQLQEQIIAAIKQYVDDVRESEFPKEEHSYS